LPGIPSVYYGSEFGIEGRKEDGDPALRPAIDLKEITEKNPDSLLTAWIEYLNAFREVHRACALGSYRELVLTNRQYAFERSLDDDVVIVVMNNDDKDVWVNVPVPLGTQLYYDAVEKATVTPENGHIAVKIPACMARIFTRTAKK
jgi:glycosidase